jgi:hypothetical protein
MYIDCIELFDYLYMLLMFGLHLINLLLMFDLRFEFHYQYML